jgi:hypothetical protein
MPRRVVGVIVALVFMGAPLMPVSVRAQTTGIREVSASARSLITLQTRLEGTVFPGLAELAKSVDRDLAEIVESSLLSPGQESVLEEVLVLPHRLPAKVASFAVFEELLDRLSSGRSLGLDQADLARCRPGVNEIGSCFPGGLVESLADLLAAQRALHVDRTAAAAVLRGSVATVFEVTPDESERHAPR